VFSLALLFVVIPAQVPLSVISGKRRIAFEIVSLCLFDRVDGAFYTNHLRWMLCFKWIVTSGRERKRSAIIANYTPVACPEPHQTDTRRNGFSSLRRIQTAPLLFPATAVLNNVFPDA